MYPGAFAPAGLPGGQRKGATDKLNDRVAPGQYAVVRVHAAEHVDDTDFPVLRPQRPESQAEQCCSGGRQGEGQPARQGFEVFAAGNAPKAGQFPDGELKCQYHQARDNPADDTEQGIGER